MRVYLCARYGKRDYLRGIAEQLRAMDHEITSRWLETSWEGKGEGSSAAPSEYREEYALKDMDDVERCQTLIAFTEPPGDGGRGGRHVELGMALAWRKEVIIIGHRENIFCHHPDVSFYQSWEEFLRVLHRARKSE